MPFSMCEASTVGTWGGYVCALTHPPARHRLSSASGARPSATTRMIQANSRQDWSIRDSIRESPCARQRTEVQCIVHPRWPDCGCSGHAPVRAIQPYPMGGETQTALGGGNELHAGRRVGIMSAADSRLGFLRPRNPRPHRGAQLIGAATPQAIWLLGFLMARMALARPRHQASRTKRTDLRANAKTRR